ncbi:transglutaminase-like domain-containing protein [Ponticoccus alexandrii]|uniref:Transglutaminase family protein n=1 Tax=Ponticoccus alexandrii TaxID=1943633 RepID=A0ABX7F900_9RHOB|nr:transglutaminase family protein [Ponticoccus alexandrii]ETA53092.1 transglutaminase [Rhodobacteraceae bacterium PD-2]QRF66752.1 transglutaminase family protein [Ponticoccus alexandrii]
MKISIDVTMRYAFRQANTVTLAIEAAQTHGQRVLSESLDIPGAQIDRIGGDSGVGSKLFARVPEGEMALRYGAEVEISRPDPSLERMAAAPLHRLTSDALQYIRPSRYCQSDKFVSFVGARFSHLEGGTKVAAIRNWIEAKLSYVPGSSDADTNVLETFAGRQGVCRDYAHLFCSMARAAQIPARMVSAYGPDVAPSDFHAVAQVWLDGDWHLVDATGMCRANGLAVVAVGRDAYDVAFMESQAPAELLEQVVTVNRIG